LNNKGITVSSRAWKIPANGNVGKIKNAQFQLCWGFRFTSLLTNWKLSNHLYLLLHKTLLWNMWKIPLFLQIVILF